MVGILCQRIVFLFKSDGGIAVSMDLSFWKYKENVYLDNQEVNEILSSGDYVEGLETLPIQQISKDIEAAFKDWKKESECDYQGEHGAFQIFTTEQFVRFDCYGMYQDDLNKLIDVLLKYECPLYDPQISERFDGHTT